VAGGSTVPPEDLSSFCELEYPRLVGTLTLYCGNHAVAEELAQETLIKVCQHWRRVRGLQNPGAWAHHVATNLANSYFRRAASERRVRRRLTQRRWEAHEDPDVGETIDLLRTLRDLPPRQRTVLILRYYVGLSVQEVADQMGCPEGTVKRLTHKTLVALRHTVRVEEFREVRNET
jgi:RNA polymerase sigma-70 factor (sigma-E family)